MIPIKAKWLALFDGAYFLYGMIFGGMASRIAIVMSLLNFILYFVMSRSGRYNPKEIKRKQQFRSQVTRRSGKRSRMAVTAVPSAAARIWTIPSWYSASAQNVRGITNTARTISTPISM